MRNLLSSLKRLNNRVFGFGLVLALVWPMQALAEEIFHWVDTNGVHHFSQSPPPGATGELETMEINGSQPASYDPEEDRYNLVAQEAAMKERRQKLEESRKNQQQDLVPPAQNTIVYYPPETAASNQILYPPGYRPGFPNWPNRPKPPHRPDWPDGKPDKPGTLPEEEPPASFPFRPLRSQP